MRQVEEALARQVIYGGDLVTNLLEVARVDESVLTVLLAESMRLAPAPTGELPARSDDVRSLVPREIALQRSVVPLEVQVDGKLVLAVAEPLPADLAEQLRFALGMSLEQRAAPAVRVHQALARTYGVPLDRRMLRLIARLGGDSPELGSTPPPLGFSSVASEPAGPPNAPTARDRTGSTATATVVGRLVPKAPGHRITNAGFPAAPVPLAPAAAPPSDAASGGESAAVASPQPPVVETAQGSPPAPAGSPVPPQALPVSPSPPPVAPASPGEVRGHLLQRAVSIGAAAGAPPSRTDHLDLARSEADEAGDRDALLDLVLRLLAAVLRLLGALPRPRRHRRGARRVRRRRVARAGPRHRRSARHAEHALDGPREAPVGHREGPRRRARRGLAHGPASRARLRDGHRPARRAHPRRRLAHRRLRRCRNRPRERAAGRRRSRASSARRSSGSSSVASSTASSPEAARAPPAASRRRWSRRSRRARPRPSRRMPPRARRRSPRSRRRASPRPSPRPLRRRSRAPRRRRPRCPSCPSAPPPRGRRPARPGCRRPPRTSRWSGRSPVRRSRAKSPTRRVWCTRSCAPRRRRPRWRRSRACRRPPDRRPSSRIVELEVGEPDEASATALFDELGWEGAQSPETGLPPSSAVAVAAHWPPAPVGPVKELPSIIVDDPDADLVAMVDRLASGEVDEAAEGELLRQGERAMRAIMSRFPGPVSFSRARIATANDPPRASDCGPILRLVARERRVALPFVLDWLTAHDAEVRGWAAHLVMRAPVRRGHPAPLAPPARPRRQHERIVARSPSLRWRGPPPSPCATRSSASRTARSRGPRGRRRRDGAPARRDVRPGARARARRQRRRGRRSRPRRPRAGDAAGPGDRRAPLASVVGAKLGASTASSGSSTRSGTTSPSCARARPKSCAH